MTIVMIRNSRAEVVSLQFILRNLIRRRWVQIDTSTASDEPEASIQTMLNICRELRTWKTVVINNVGTSSGSAMR